MVYTALFMACELFFCRTGADFFFALPKRVDAKHVFEPQSAWIVPSAGYARWLQIRYVQREDILFRPAVHHAAAFLWHLVEQWRPSELSRMLDVDHLMWCIMAVLQLEQPDGLAKIRQRLQTTRARYLFAKEMAHLFKSYYIYRPDWTACWMKNHSIEGIQDEDALWQQELWQRVHTLYPAQQDTHALLDFIRFLADSPTAQRVLHCPQRIDLFFPTALAPLYLEAFVSLGAIAHVVFWVTVPSREYWGDLHTEKSYYLSLLRRPDDGYVYVSHRLLSSWGHQRRDLIDCLLNASIECDLYETQPALVQLANPSTWLGAIQHSMWTLTTPVTMPASPDSSLRIMACHSFARECEILHDALWHLFLEDPTLSLADVLVQVPDIAQAAPLIEASFGSVAAARYIPYVLSGSCGRMEAYCDAILSFFRLALTRFEKSTVLHFLQRPVILHALHLSLDDIRVLNTWLEGVQVRWGLPEEGVPHAERYTWSQGVHRLWLTFCLPPCSHWQGQHVASYGPVGEDLHILAACQHALSIFQEWQKRVQKEKGLTQWLEDMVEGMRIWEPDAHSTLAYQKMIAVIEEIKKSHVVSPDVAIDCQTFLDFFVEHLTQEAPGALPYPVVTITQYGALQSVPYRVVCCLQMNKGVMPRCVYKTEHSLMSRYPRLGDLIPPLADKDAFLEVVLSCQYLYLSYQEKDHCGHCLERSTLIDDVLHFASDQPPFCEAACPFEAVQACLVLHHSMHPFTRTAFLHVQLPSVAYEYLCAAPPPAPQSPRSVPPVQTGVSWSMDYLAAVLVHPVRFFLREQRRVQPARTGRVVPDTEPFVLTPAQFFRLVQAIFYAPTLMNSVLDQHVPAGYVGLFFRERICDRLHKLTQDMDTFCQHRSRKTIDFSCTLPAHHSIFGRATQVVEYAKNHFLRFVCGHTSPAYLLQQWIQHVCVQYGLQQKEYASMITIVMQDHGNQVMLPLSYEEAQRLVSTYVHCAQQAHSRPVPFFVKTAYQWLKYQENETYAYQAWLGSAFAYGESQDMWHRLLFPQPGQALTPQSFEYAHLLWDDCFRYCLSDIETARDIREIVIE